MWLPRMKAITGFFLAAILFVPAWATDTNSKAAVPGTIKLRGGNSFDR
jgi:hypothetical protein